MSQLASLDLSLHPKQGEALQTTANEVLYGGAAGGGKSHLMRVAAILWCAAIPGLQVYLFRRIRDDLVKNHMEGPKGFRSMLAGWELCGFVKIVVDADTGKILGITAVAKDAGELAAAGVHVLGKTVAEVADAWAPYLTMAEGIRIVAKAFTTDVSKLSCCA